MSSDYWFSISGIAISYVFLICLSITLLATISSCIALLKCCDCFEGNVRQPGISTSTSMVAMNGTKITNRDQVKDVSIGDLPTSTLVLCRMGSTNRHLISSYQTKIETEVWSRTISLFVFIQGFDDKTYVFVIFILISKNGVWNIFTLF